jgi:hypothetical protein
MRIAYNLLSVTFFEPLRKKRSMLCPACERDCSSATVCPHCGVSLGNPGAQVSAGDAFTSKENNSAINRLKSLSFIGAVGVGWILIVYLSYLRTVRWSGGVRNAESSGYFIGSLLTPVLVVAFVVWLINRARKDKMSPAHKHLLTVVLALGITLVSFAGSLRQTPGFDESSDKKRMGHLLRQAAGKEAATSDSEWYEGPTREFFRDILAFNQEYTGAIQSLDRSSIAKLYTPESYVTRAGMQTTVCQLHALLDVDEKYKSSDQLLKKMEVNITATTASETEKEEFLKGFRGSFSKSLAPRSETFRLEEEWLQSSIELYEFTLSHFGDYSARGKKLIFRGGASPVEFQNLQSKAITLRKAAIEAKHKLDSARQDAMSQTGVTPADISASASKEK